MNLSLAELHAAAQEAAEEALAREADAKAADENAAALAAERAQEAREKLRVQRDELLESATGGMYRDKASQEWREMPVQWRMALLMLAGMGGPAAVRAGLQLQLLALRNWRELPPAERDAVSSIVRIGRPHIARLIALSARV